MASHGRPAGLSHWPDPSHNSAQTGATTWAAIWARPRPRPRPGSVNKLLNSVQCFPVFYTCFLARCTVAAWHGQLAICLCLTHASHYLRPVSSVYLHTKRVASFLSSNSAQDCPTARFASSPPTPCGSAELQPRVSQSKLLSRLCGP